MPSFYLTYWLIYFQALLLYFRNYFPSLKITRYHYLNSAQLQYSLFVRGIVTRANLTDPEQYTAWLESANRLYTREFLRLGRPPWKVKLTENSHVSLSPITAVTQSAEFDGKQVPSSKAICSSVRNFFTVLRSLLAYALLSILFILPNSPFRSQPMANL